MQNIIKCAQKVVIGIFSFILATPMMAALPTPPSNDMPTGSNDWIDVGGSLVEKALQYGCLVLGVIILAGAAGGIIKAYHVAHEKQDLGHFFKMLIVGLIAAAVGMGLVYAGYSIVNTQSN